MSENKGLIKAELNKVIKHRWTESHIMSQAMVTGKWSSWWGCKGDRRRHQL